jgi:hypothetical protein
MYLLECHHRVCQECCAEKFYEGNAWPWCFICGNYKAYDQEMSPCLTQLDTNATAEYVQDVRRRLDYTLVACRRKDCAVRECCPQNLQSRSPDGSEEMRSLSRSSHYRNCQQRGAALCRPSARVFVLQRQVASYDYRVPIPHLNSFPSVYSEFPQISDDIEANRWSLAPTPPIVLPNYCHEKTFFTSSTVTSCLQIAQASLTVRASLSSSQERFFASVHFPRHNVRRHFLWKRWKQPGTLARFLMF